MAVKLIEVTRGDVVESVHRGDIAIVNYKGDLLYYAGDPGKITYIRSAAKPIQALNVILSSAFNEYKLSYKELAVMCASHYGEDFHRETVENILHKAGLSKENILGGSVPSLSNEIALKQAWNNLKSNQLFSDCSGKHAGFLSVCQKKGYPIDTYMNMDHPLQQEILTLISQVCQYPRERIQVGIDGCSVPVHAFPVFNMALGYARLAKPVNFDSDLSEASQMVFRAMTQHPEMVSGTNGFCTDLIGNTNGKLIGKVGAEGIYCIGLKNEGIGIALKMEDGNMHRLPPVIIKLLSELNVLTEQELSLLKKYHPIDNLNDLGTKVGDIKASFELTKA
jgi:L-asparaginase II